MTTIKVDFSNIIYFDEVHKTIKKAFEFPDYYGENLDALWDCLDGDFCPLDAHIEISGIEHLNNKFNGYGDKIKKYLKIYQKNMEMKI